MSGFISAPAWTAEEDAIIIDARQIGAGNKLIAQQLPGRTENAVASRVRHLRNKGWFVGSVPGSGRPRITSSDADAFDADEAAFRRQAARGSAMLLAAIIKLTAKGGTNVL